MVSNQDDRNEVDLAIGSIAESSGQYSPTGRDGRFTIAEAAQIKGVSYHTVSRAIRRGRLPVVRLGRMALIAQEDLIAWRPMRERAPRKYRQADPETESGAPQLDVSQGGPLDLAQRLSTYYEDIHLAASESCLPEFATLVCERFAEGFGLTRAGFWVIDEQVNLATKVAHVDSSFEPFPSYFELADFPFVLNFAKSGQTRLILDLKAELTDWADATGTGGIEVLLIAPLRLRDRALGIVCGDRSGALIRLTQEQLSLAQRLANQAALAFGYNRSLSSEIQQSHQLATVVEQVDAAICACDARGRMTILNARHRTLAGYADAPADALLGMHARDYLAMNSDRRFHLDGTPFPIDAHPLLRAIQGESTRNVEYRIVHDGKPPITISASGTPIVINGEITGCISTGQEITAEQISLERERTLLATTVSERAQLDRIVDSSVAFSKMQNVDDVYDHLLTVLIEALGADFGSIYLQEQPGKLSLTARLNHSMPNDGVRTYDVMALPNTAVALASGIPTLLCRDSTLMLEARLQSESDVHSTLIVPLKFDSESIGAAYINYREAVELATADYEFADRIAELGALALVRIRGHQSIIASQTRLLATIDQLPQALLIISYPAGEVLIANRAAEQMWGTTLRDPTTLAEDLPVIDVEGRRSEREHHPLLRVLQTGRHYLGEPLTVECSDGALIEVLANHAPILDPHGLMLGTVSILQDRANFKPLDRAKDEFLSVVAHEIRNPLTSLRGNLQLLERRMRRAERESVDAEVKRIRTVIDQVDRIAELVSRMLDISRADLGKLDLSVAETDASAIIQSVVDEVTGTDPVRDVRVTSPVRVSVVWDEVRIQQVLVNLLTNALRYAPDGPIEVALSLIDNDMVRIMVRDHGHGVPPRIRKRLFKQYYRFDDGQEDREPAFDGSRGLGIGLYISARLAREHGGRLEVDDAVGGGAVFTLTLPRLVASDSTGQ